MKIETHPEHAGCYFVSDDENQFIAELQTNSWDDFERSIDNLIKLHKRILLKKKNIFRKFFDRFSTTKYKSGQTCAAEFASYFINHPRREFYNLIPFVYFWTLKSGYIETVQVYETRIFPHIAHKISITEGRRWLFAYDSMIEPDDRVELYIEWMKEEQAVTQHDRIDRLIALHGLFIIADQLNNRLKERVYVIYTDFMKREENKDIEKIFGELIEADFVTLKKRREITLSKRSRKIEDETLSFLSNWLMRRYAVEKVIINHWFWVLSFSLFFCWSFLAYKAYSISYNIPPLQLSSPILLILPIFLFLLGWNLGGKYLSKIIWGTAIGWFFVFSAVFVDMVYQEFQIAKPQIMALKGLYFLFAIIIFGGIILMMIWKEIKDANVLSWGKRLGRLFLTIVAALPFGLLEGLILLGIISPNFSNMCWFNRWVCIILALGTIQAMSIGLITQLIWESRRLTEIVRK